MRSTIVSEATAISPAYPPLLSRNLTSSFQLKISEIANSIFDSSHHYFQKEGFFEKLDVALLNSSIGTLAGSIGLLIFGMPSLSVFALALSGTALFGTILVKEIILYKNENVKLRRDFQNTVYKNSFELQALKEKNEVSWKTLISTVETQAELDKQISEFENNTENFQEITQMNDSQWSTINSARNEMKANKNLLEEQTKKHLLDVVYSSELEEKKS